MTVHATTLTSRAAGAPTIDGRAVGKILDAAGEYGVSPRELLGASGSAPPMARIPFAAVVALYERAALLSGDPDFGLRVAERVDAEAFEHLGYMLRNSRTMGEALERLGRYHSLWNDGMQLGLDRRGNALAVRMEYVDGNACCRQDAEMTLATIVVLGRRLSGEDFRPVAVQFRHPAPESLATHERIFRCPLSFGAASYELVLRTDVEDLPLRSADLRLGNVLAACASRLSAPPAEPITLVHTVHGLVSRLLPTGEARMPAVAAELGMSGRSLQRRLAQEGTSFERIVESTRRELAEAQLRRKVLRVADIAHMLGYSEPSAFVRAFRRWTGLSPTAYAAGES